jgi:hypothetical protein
MVVRADDEKLRMNFADGLCHVPTNAPCCFLDNFLDSNSNSNEDTTL